MPNDILAPLLLMVFIGFIFILINLSEIADAVRDVGVAIHAMGIIAKPEPSRRDVLVSALTVLLGRELGSDDYKRLDRMLATFKSDKEILDNFRANPTEPRA